MYFLGAASDQQQNAHGKDLVCPWCWNGRLLPMISSNVQMVTWCPVSRLGNFFAPANVVTELWNATHYLYPRCSFTVDRYWPSHSYEVILQHLPENCRKKTCKALATEAEHNATVPCTTNDLRASLMLFC